MCGIFSIEIRPAFNGSGCGRALLAELWRDGGRRMTSSSLHAHALPLRTSFGFDAWWPRLYLRSRVGALVAPAGWQAKASPAAEVSALELSWTGVYRSADHLAWARRPGGADAAAAVLAVLASLEPESGWRACACPGRTQQSGRCLPRAGGVRSSTCSWRPSQTCSTRAGRCRRRRWPERGHFPRCRVRQGRFRTGDATDQAYDERLRRVVGRANVA